MVYDTIILGGGAAGYAAAIYARRYLLKTAVIQGNAPGGETASAGVVENYPGFPSIDGFELMQKFEEHAKLNGTELVFGTVVKIEQHGHCFQLTADDGKVWDAKTIIFALGSEHRRLGLEREMELKGRGIHYCVTCDGPLFKNKRVVLVGGGDSSVKGASLLAAYASHVWLVTREKELHAEPVNLKRMQTKKNIQVVYEAQLTKLFGGKKLKAVEMSKPIEGQTRLTVDGVFIEVGLIPRTELPKSVEVKLDDHGNVNVDQMMRTNIDGIFAAGDLTNATGNFKQIVTAAAQGALAATAAYQDIGEHGDQVVCQIHSRVVSGE